MPGVPGQSFRTVQIGPGDTTSFERKMRGKMSLVCVAPPSAHPKAVEVMMDGRSIGKGASTPFTVEFDSTTVTDGAHTIKAVGRDAAGKEVWSASTKVQVVNSVNAGPERLPSKPSGGANPPGVMSPGAGRTRSGGPPRPVRPDNAGKQGKDKGTGVRAVPAGLGLDSTYSNYGFSIKYPATWTFKDRTVTMKPKAAGDFWVAFGVYPIEKAKLVVNVRRVKLAPGTDAAKFVQYNSYVKKWQSETVLDSPAFSTTSHVLTPKKGAIHRAIIIKGGSAWMLNCEDFSGKPADESLGLFEAMIQTIAISGATP